MFKNLVLSQIDGRGATFGQLVRLSGTATFGMATELVQVSTELDVCTVDTAPRDCPSSPRVGQCLTSTLVKNDAGAVAPLTLAAGQIVQVTVTISFSSPAGS